MSDSLHRALERLDAAITPRLTTAGAEWLASARGEIRSQVESVFRFFAAAGRRVGQGPLVDPPNEGAVRLFRTEGPILNPWQIQDGARAILLVEAALAEPLEAERRLADLYRFGAGAERIAVLRALQLFPDSEAGFECVRDALRASAVDLFEAAICENLFTSRRLPDSLFFQAALKCVFVGSRLERVERLRERATPELSRMLYGYVTEREQARRPVPPDVWPLIALHPPPGAEGRPEVARAGGER